METIKWATRFFLVGLILWACTTGCALDVSGLDFPDPVLHFPDAGAQGGAAAIQGAAGGAGGKYSDAMPGGQGGEVAGEGGAPAAGGTSGSGGDYSGVGGVLAAGGTGGGAQGGAGGRAAPDPTFIVTGSECDPITGARAGGGGARCEGGKTCAWTCPGPGRATCSGDTFDGRSCAGGPCGWTTWAGGPRKMLACAFGSACGLVAGGVRLSVGTPSETTSDGVCQRYCAGDAACGGAPGSCDHAALPCAPEGTGLCPASAPVISCDRV